MFRLSVSPALSKLFWLYLLLVVLLFKNKQSTFNPKKTLGLLRKKAPAY